MGAIGKPPKKKSNYYGFLLTVLIYRVLLNTAYVVCIEQLGLTVFDLDLDSAVLYLLQHSHHAGGVVGYPDYDIFSDIAVDKLTHI